MKHTLLITALIIACVAFVAHADIPQTLSYQGVLTDGGGSAVADGDYSIEFGLYDVPSGGSALWSETQLVTVTKGIFNVVLGLITPLNLSFDSQYYLGMSVEGGAELSPRIPLNASAYSLNSRAVAGSDNVFPSNSNVGIGTVNPAEKLEVVGAIKIGNTSNTNAGTIRWTGSDFEGYDGNTWKTLAVSIDDTLYPGVSGQTLRHDGTGWAATSYLYNDGARIGIGTAAPNAELEVIGDNILNHFMLTASTGAGPAIYLNAVNKDWVIYGSNPASTAGDQKLVFRDQSTATDHMVIDSDGDVGIGEVSPNAPLHVAGGNWDLDGTEGDFKVGDDTYRLKIGVATGGADAGSAGIRVQGGLERLIIGAGSAEVVAVESDGGVEIGSSTQAGRLDIYGDGIAAPTVSANTSARGGLFYCYDELGNLTTTMQPDGHGTGGYFYVRRSESSTGFRVDGNYGGYEEPRVEILGSSELAAFRMYETGDATVVFPVDAISSSEIFNETGTASYTSGIDGVLLLSTPTILGSQSIVTPAAGYVLAIATGQAEIDHASGTTSSFDFGVSDDSGTFPDNQDIFLRLNGGLSSGYYDLPVTVHGLFEVALAGSYTFFFLGRQAEGSCTCYDVQLTLLFIPTLYGTVMPALASGRVADTDDNIKQALNTSDVAAQRIASEDANTIRIEQELKAIRAELEALKNEVENK